MYEKEDVILKQLPQASFPSNIKTCNFLREKGTCNFPKANGPKFLRKQHSLRQMSPNSLSKFDCLWQMGPKHGSPWQMGLSSLKKHSFPKASELKLPKKTCFCQAHVSLGHLIPLALGTMFWAYLFWATIFPQGTWADLHR
jgi:hypothetical protein